MGLRIWSFYTSPKSFTCIHALLSIALSFYVYAIRKKIDEDREEINDRRGK
ncbi:mechanosensitive ion channel family protein [Sesbania bispinosa]|nr:mechanosensitive ion channel family protein [Sesbania bispinosa]